MKKVTKWHCFLADYSFFLAHGYAKHSSFKCEVLTVDKNNLNNWSIALLCFRDTEAGHRSTSTMGARRPLAHATYGNKREALRAMLPLALERMAGDMAATVKLMKFMEDNGLDLEEEALE